MRSPTALVRFAPLALLLLVCSVSVDTQSFFLKKCPKQKVVQNFQANEYLGLWYENRKYFAIFQAGGQCVTATYTDQDNGLIGVENAMINFIGKEQTVNGQAKLADPTSTEARLSVSFTSTTPYADTADTVTDANYLVLDTDYSTYSVVWSCTDFKWLFNKQFLWILTRERNPPASVLETALNVVTNRGLDESRFLITNQTNC